MIAESKKRNIFSKTINLMNKRQSNDLNQQLNVGFKDLENENNS